MLAHGNKKFTDYPGIMAAEKPKMWGDTIWREAHVGHHHRRQRLLQDLQEYAGATVRVLPSLRPPDAWHSEQGYVGNIRAAEAYVWNKNEGLIGSATYSITKP